MKNKELKIREKREFYGVEGLNDGDIIADITGIKPIVVERKIKEYNSVYNFINTGFKDKELTKRQSEKLESLKELYERFNKSCANNKKKLNSPHVVNEVMRHIAQYEQEVFYLLIMDSKLRLLKSIELFKGSINISISHPRDIFREILKYNGASFFICHNHPSGDPSPSQEDTNFTLALHDASRMMNIPMMDHVIIGKEGYYSYKEAGLI